MNNIMITGAKNVLSTVLSLESGNKVLIITDEEKMEIGNVFEKAAQEMGAIVRLYTLPEDERPLKETPTDLVSLIPGNHIIINAFSGIPEETPFRIKLVKSEMAANARTGHAPGITKRMMVDGPMTADYTEIAKTADHLMGLFDNAKMVHITTPSGTDISLDIQDRTFQTDLKIRPGTFGNLPAGEIWCGPVEDGANGEIVCDGSIGDIGQVPSPLTIKVKNGKIQSMNCEKGSFKDRLWELTHIDEMSDVVGELGIGLNPEAKLVGNLLEDEKAGGTAHVAFGNNTDMPGGKNTSSTHRDFLFYNPTMVVTYKDDKQKEIMRKGKMLQ